MQEIAVKSGWDTLLIGVPLIGMLVIAFFRLDEKIVTTKVKLVCERPACGEDENGEGHHDRSRWPQMGQAVAPPMIVLHDGQIPGCRG